MSDRRIEPEDLGGLEDLDPADPRKAGLETQPRTRAQLRAYRDFVAPGDEPAGARLAEAEARLAEVLEREGLGATASAPERAAGRSWLARLLSPSFRPALGFAAVMIAAGAVWLATLPKHPPSPPVMRSVPPVTTPSDRLATMEPVTLEHGGVRLEWSEAPGADAYRVVFLSPALDEIARVEDLREPRLEIDAGARPGGLAPGSRVIWRAEALARGDVIASTESRALTLP